MAPWRTQVACLLGQGTTGAAVASTTPTFEATYSGRNNQYLRSDRIPFEAIVGWDATGNGNLAQLLQEPTLMGAYEGAGVTVVGRGIKIPAASTDFWGLQGGAVAGAFPDGSVYLTNGTQNSTNSCA